MDKGGAQPLPIFCETVMKYILIITLSLSFLSIDAQAGSPEIGDEINAKIARIKSVRSPSNQGKLDQDKRSGDANGVLGDGCNIAIGNVIDSGKGALTSARRETTVVITGDVCPGWQPLPVKKALT
jgi:hypothetical protein